MNRQVWRETKDLMVLVNSSGSALLAAMDGERPFTEIVGAAFANTDKGLKGINLPDLTQFGRGWEYEDRFFTSSAFLMSLWMKGFIHLMLAPAGGSALGHIEWTAPSGPPVAVSLLQGIWQGEAWSAHLGDVGGLVAVFVICTALSAKVFRWE